MPGNAARTRLFNGGLFTALHLGPGTRTDAVNLRIDRSIDGPAAFIETNIVGTYTLLEAARAYWSELADKKKTAFRFHHISTDEVYGDLHSTDDFFTETTPYAPSSPYSASKASSDHLVRAWLRTYGFPTLITN